MAISMLKIRRPLGRLIFNMGIAIPGKTVFLIETAPWTGGTHYCYMYNFFTNDKKSNAGPLQEPPDVWLPSCLQIHPECGWISYRVVFRSGGHKVTVCQCRIWNRQADLNIQLVQIICWVTRKHHDIVNRFVTFPSQSKDTSIRE